MRQTRILSLFFFGLIASGNIPAAPGELDATFGSPQGWVSIGYESVAHDSHARAALQQADGKIVVAGATTGDPEGGQFAVMRYLADGSLDPAFGVHGKSVTNFGDFIDESCCMVQQPDGKLVIAGSSDDGDNHRIALVRYNTDGTVDPAFGVDGKVTTLVASMSNSPLTARSVIHQPDGKLLVAASEATPYPAVVILLRYTADGLPDTTFDTDGQLVIYASDFPYEASELSDGKVLAAGSRQNWLTGEYFLFLARLDSSGAIDSTFADNGIARRQLDYETTPSTIASQQDGKIIVGGHIRINGNNDFVLMRYHPDGSPDLAFGTNGMVITAAGPGDDSLRSISEQPDGKLVVTGSTGDGTNSDPVVVRYHHDGTLDTGFNLDGMLLVDGNSNEDQYWASLTMDGNRLLLVGELTDNGRHYFHLRRLLSDGSTDTTFGDNGNTLTAVTESEDQGYAMLQQDDDKLVVAGSTRGDIAIVRLLPDGSLDKTFNDDGKAALSVSPDVDTAYAIAQQPDGKLVTAGRTRLNGSYDWALARFLANGTPDISFGDDGKLVIPFSTNQDIAKAIVVDGSGKLVVAGLAYNGASRDFVLTRHHPDGSLDTTWAGDGKRFLDFGGDDFLYTVLLQSDGRVVSVGSTNNGTTSHMAAARFNSDGSADTTFNATGQFTLQPGEGSSYASAVAAQPDGKLVIVGASDSDGENGISRNIAVIRLNTDGSLDTSFATGGILLLPVGSYNSDARSVVVQPDGKIVIAGISDAGYGFGFGADFLLMRLEADGSLDTAFSEDGLLQKGFGKADGSSLANGTDIPYSLVRQRDGRLVVAGTAYNLRSGVEIVVMRVDAEADSDLDGVPDSVDAFPLDPGESIDSDSDATGNNADWDDDNDGIPDSVDADPLDAANNNETRLPLDTGFRGSGVREAMDAR